MRDAETKGRIGGLGATEHYAAAAFAAQHCAELSMGSRPRLSAAAAFAAQHCAELSMGSRPRLSAAAAFAARLEPPGWRPGIVII